MPFLAVQNHCLDWIGLDWAVSYVPPTQYRLYRGRFLQVKRPSQQNTLCLSLIALYVNELPVYAADLWTVKIAKRLFHFGVSVIMVNSYVKSLMGLLSVGVVLCNVCTMWLLQSNRMYTLWPVQESQSVLWPDEWWHNCHQNQALVLFVSVSAYVLHVFHVSWVVVGSRYV